MRAQPHIRIIDDEASVRVLLRALLQREGYRVSEVDNPLSVQVRDTDNPPDLVIVDLNMRGLDGFGVCREFKRAGVKPVPVLVLSGYSDPENRAKAEEAGADAFMSKPVDAPKLLGTISELLSRSQETD
jgi:DNA-binding response OmpR family regulator